MSKRWSAKALASDLTCTDGGAVAKKSRSCERQCTWSKKHPLTSGRAGMTSRVQMLSIYLMGRTFNVDLGPAETSRADFRHLGREAWQSHACLHPALCGLPQKYSRCPSRSPRNRWLLPWSLVEPPSLRRASAGMTSSELLESRHTCSSAASSRDFSVLGSYQGDRLYTAPLERAPAWLCNIASLGGRSSMSYLRVVVSTSEGNGR